MIVTRYKAAKLTGINESVFSQMWKRHCAEKELYNFFTEDGKVNIEDPTFRIKYETRIKPEELQKIKDKLKPKKKPVKKKPPKKVSRETKKETVVEKPKTPRKKKDKIATLTEQKLQNEVKKLDKQNLQLDIKNSQARGLLIEKESLSDTVYGYIDALNHNIMSIPKGIIDDFAAGIKTKMTRSELINILTLPICEAIHDTKVEIKKEIAKTRVHTENIIDEV